MNKPKSSKKLLAEIDAAAKSGDDEAAHSLERDLWEKTLREIAADGDARAVLALKSLDFQFSRWTA